MDYSYINMTIDDLKSHEARKTSLINLNDEMMALELDKTSLGGSSNSEAVQNSNFNKQETRLINIISKQGNLKLQIESTELRIRRVDRALKTLNKTELRVLQLFYVTPQKDCVERLRNELNYEKSTVYNVKDNALKHLTIALYGGIEI